MKPILLVTSLASALLFAACGGGGSSSSPEATPATTQPSTPTTAASGSYDALKAWTQLFSTARSWTVTGVGSDAKPYTLSLATEPAGTAVFPLTGVSATKSIFRNVLTDGSTTQNVLNEQFLDAQYRMLGSRVTTDGGAPSCSKTEVVAAIPASAAPAGATGPLYAATTFGDCVVTGTALGTSYHTWSLLRENGVVYLCVASSNRFIGEATDRLSETCVETDANGNLGAKARIKLVLPGFSVIATN